MRGSPYLVSAILWLSTLGCGTDRGKEALPPGADRRLQRVILKFQDSTGWVVRSLHPDSLGTNLGHLVRAALATPVDDSLEAKLARWKGFHDDRGVAFCGCEAPMDSLILVRPSGKSEAYLLHCSSIYREAPNRSEELGLSDVQRHQLSGRWDLVREKFCPKGFGCSDGEPEDRWDYEMELREDSAWVEAPSEAGYMGWMMSEILKERQAKIADLTLRFTIRIRGGSLVSAVIDSAAPAHAAIAEDLARRLPGGHKPFSYWNGEHSLRMHLWNFRHE